MKFRISDLKKGTKSFFVVEQCLLVFCENGLLQFFLQLRRGSLEDE